MRAWNYSDRRAPRVDQSGKAYYGKASVLGMHYVSGYEPIKDASGATIGVYFVGYTKVD